jgi:hypothetical protein
MSLLFSTLSGCGKQSGHFQTKDFAFQFPAGWHFWKEKSRPDCVVFEANDRKSWLTISILYVKPDTTPQAALDMFPRVLELRRDVETHDKPSASLSAYKIETTGGHPFSGWTLNDAAANRHTVTRATLEKNKIFVLYVESVDTSEQSAGALADELFAGFQAR